MNLLTPGRMMSKNVPGHGAQLLSHRDPEMGGVSVTRYGMVIDVTKCNGCYNCFLACKDEYCGNDHKPLLGGPAHDRADAG